MKMKIMLIDNDFSGAYNSFKCFFSEIKLALSKIGNSVFYVNSIKQAIEVYETIPIDFSIGIGKYNLFKNKMALCDIYNIIHYQWIIDNPLKIETIGIIKNCIPIFIDKEFKFLYNDNSNSIYKPLGLPSKFTQLPLKRKYGILFAGQVKNIKLIEKSIEKSFLKKEIKNFIYDYSKNLNTSYIKLLLKIFKTIENKNWYELFSLTNSYFRCYKRKIVLDSIKETPLILIGEVLDENILKKKNVVYKGKVSYNKLNKLLKYYQYVLNVSPNYNKCIHDRVLRALFSGCHVVTDYSTEIDRYFKGFIDYYYYDKLKDGYIDHIVKFNNKTTIRKCVELSLKNFTWENILCTIIYDFLERRNNFVYNRLY